MQLVAMPALVDSANHHVVVVVADWFTEFEGEEPVKAVPFDLTRGKDVIGQTNGLAGVMPCLKPGFVVVELVLVVFLPVSQCVELPSGVKPLITQLKMLSVAGVEPHWRCHGNLSLADQRALARFSVTVVTVTGVDRSHGGLKRY